MSSLKLISKVIFIFILTPDLGFCQSSPTCKDLKAGQFYYYPQTSTERFLYSRSGELQKEINISTGDTTLWEIEWLNDCTYTLQYMGGGKNEGANYAMYKKHKGVIQISSITNNYFIYNAYRDKISDIVVSSDTLWLKEKIVDDRTFKASDFVEASFPGGDNAWKNYITEVITDNIKQLTRANKTGTCYVTFIVDKDGSITEVEALTMEDTKLAKVAIKAIINGPNWKPALMKGKPVKAYRIQPVTFNIVSE